MCKWLLMVVVAAEVSHSDFTRPGELFPVFVCFMHSVMFRFVFYFVAITSSQKMSGLPARIFLPYNMLYMNTHAHTHCSFVVLKRGTHPLETVEFPESPFLGRYYFP